MASSQDESVAAALDYLGTPYTTTLTVHAVVEGGPAEGSLRAGDELVSVDGSPVTSLGQLRSHLDEAGSEGADVTVRRDGATTTEHVDLTRGENGQQRGVAREYPDLTVDRARRDLGGLALPHLTVGGDDFNLQRAHGRSSHLEGDWFRAILPAGRVR